MAAPRPIGLRAATRRVVASLGQLVRELGYLVRPPLTAAAEPTPPEAPPAGRPSRADFEPQGPPEAWLAYVAAHDPVWFSETEPAAESDEARAAGPRPEAETDPREASRLVTGPDAMPGWTSGPPGGSETDPARPARRAEPPRGSRAEPAGGGLLAPSARPARPARARPARARLAPGRQGGTGRDDPARPRWEADPGPAPAARTPDPAPPSLQLPLPPSSPPAFRAAPRRRGPRLRVGEADPSVPAAAQPVPYRPAAESPPPAAGPDRLPDPAARTERPHRAAETSRVRPEQGPAADRTARTPARPESVPALPRDPVTERDRWPALPPPPSEETDPDRLPVALEATVPRLWRQLESGGDDPLIAQQRRR